jgi:predicted component of type VI protein secretion system
LRLAFEGRSAQWCDGPVRIGRAPDNQLASDDASLSRHHAEINLTRLGWVLRDLDSANGVWRGGTRLPNLVLRTGDEVLLGKFAVSVLEARAARAAVPWPAMAAALAAALVAAWVYLNRVPAAAVPSGAPLAHVPEAPPEFGPQQAAAWVRAALSPGATGADLAAGRLALLWRAQAAPLTAAEQADAAEIDRRLEARLTAGAAAYLRAAHVGDRAAADAALRDLYEAFPPADARYVQVQALRQEAP